MTTEEFKLLAELIVEKLEEYEDVEISHFGVKGMKWGVRKGDDRVAQLRGLGPDSLSLKTKYGETVTVQKTPPGMIPKLRARMSAKFVDKYNDGVYLDIKNSSGTTVGDAVAWKKGTDELYLSWLGIESKQRGKGYASAVMEAAVEYGKSEGLKKLTLEVPGASKDAQHIYTKLGFKPVGEVSGNDRDVWGGLQPMEYTFDQSKTKVKHFMSDNPEDYELYHFGVKGMKWGVRKDSDGIPLRTSREAAKDAKEFTKAKMYYGDGAGNRRKLIKAKVESKAKKDPQYKKAFDKHVENTDLGVRAAQARSQRKRTDTTNSVKKTARGVGHIVRGNAQYASLAAAGLFAAGAAAYKNGGEQFVKKHGKTAFNYAKNEFETFKTMRTLRNMGFNV